MPPSELSAKKRQVSQRSLAIYQKKYGQRWGILTCNSGNVKHKHNILARKVDFLSPWGFHQKLGLSNGDLNHQNAKHKDAVYSWQKHPASPEIVGDSVDWWFRESKQLKPFNSAIFHVGFCNSATVTPSAKSHGAIYFDRDSICNASAGEYQAENPIMQNFKSTNLTCT